MISANGMSRMWDVYHGSVGVAKASMGTLVSSVRSMQHDVLYVLWSIAFNIYTEV